MLPTLPGNLAIMLTELGNQQKRYHQAQLSEIFPQMLYFTPDVTITSRYKGEEENPLLQVTAPILAGIKQLSSGLHVFEFPHPKDPAVIIGVDSEVNYVQPLLDGLNRLVGRGIVSSVMFTPNYYRY